MRAATQQLQKIRSTAKLLLVAGCLLPILAGSEPSDSNEERIVVAALDNPAPVTRPPASIEEPALSGERLFADNCASCHGIDGRGAKGVPDLTNNIWQYGDTPEMVHLSITNGRKGLMPSFGIPLGEAGLEAVTEYVLNFSGRSSAGDDVLTAGAEQYSIFCSSCHGNSGNGTQTIGAPDLTDNYWLHGNSRAEIQSVIRNGRAANMPAHADNLDDMQIAALVDFTLELNNATIKLAEASE